VRAVSCQPVREPEGDKADHQHDEDHDDREEDIDRAHFVKAVSASAYRPAQALAGAPRPKVCWSAAGTHRRRRARAGRRSAPGRESSLSDLSSAEYGRFSLHCEVGPGLVIFALTSFASAAGYLGRWMPRRPRLGLIHVAARRHFRGWRARSLFSTSKTTPDEGQAFGRRIGDAPKPPRARRALFCRWGQAR
jgi:hypothetical protein